MLNYPLACSYDATLVAVSIAIAIVAAYIVLELAERVTGTQGTVRPGWLVGGAIVLGTGIWAMHFVGMLAYEVTVPVHYRPGIVLVSIVPSILASGGALFLVSRPQGTLLTVFGGSVLMGVGMTAMHYTGMAALSIPSTTLHYNRLLVAISVAIAIAASFVVLSIALRLRAETSTVQTWKKIGSAVLMGTAVPLTHYLGIAAVTIQVNPVNPRSPNLAPVASQDNLLLASAVGLGTLIIISLTILISFLDRRLSAQSVQTQLLQSHQEELQTILHGVRVGVLVLGPNLEIQMANHAVLGLLGVTQAELQTAWEECLVAQAQVPSPSSAIAAPSAFQLEALQSVLQAIAAQQALQNVVFNCVQPQTNQPRWLLVNAVPECRLLGREQKIICTFSDVTNLKQAEQALQKSEAENRALAKLAEAKSQALSHTLKELQQAQSQIVHQEKMSSLGMMVAGIAHEINNPVTFIYGNLTHAEQYVQDLVQLLHQVQKHPDANTSAFQDLIQTTDLNFILEDLPKLFRSMQLGADRIREIVASLRNFSRLDEAAVKKVNLHEGLDSTLLILGHRLKAFSNRPAIHIVKDYHALPLIECYAGQLNQVFMNVLSNAIDALEAGLKKGHVDPHANFQPQIRIQTLFLAEQDRIQIRISDNGPGMTATILKKIFDPFYTTKPVGKGTGLGLFISYQIIERHNGLFRCSSQPGGGTEFVIEIPVHHPNERLAIAQELAHDRPKSQAMSQL